MDETMEESRGQEEADPGLLDDVVQVSVDTDGIVVELGGAEDEVPPDWLEPLEEDYVEDGKEGVGKERRAQTRAKSTRGGWRKGRRRNPVLDDEWLDCPDLGKGWKRKVVFLRTGAAVGRKIMHYMSPKGFRVRSKKELNRRVKVDLTHFDFNQGIFVDGVVTTKQRRSSATEATTRSVTRSTRRSSRASTPNRNRTPDKLTRTPQKPHLTPNPPTTSVVAPSPSNEPYNSTPQLTKASPVAPQAQQPSLSPSLRLGDISPQSLGPFTTAEKGKAGLLAHSWLQSPLAPVSPTEAPEKDLFTHPSAVKSSPGFHLPLDSSAVLNGGNQENGISLNGCTNCGCTFPGMGSGEGLCPKCTLKKKQRSPHIIFKKVGQDKWVVGKTKAEGFLKKKIPPLGKKRYAAKSHRLKTKKVEKEKIEEIKKQDSEEEDDCAPDGADDDDEFGPKKRKRRMCGQCKACLRDQDCGKCDFCMDKPKFGGHNKKRQKCRFRQCQFRSRLKTWRRMKYKKRAGLVNESEDEEADEMAGELGVQNSDRSLRKQKRKRRLWDNDDTDNEDNDDNEGEDPRPGKKGQQDGGRKRRYSLKQEEDEEDGGMGEPEDGDNLEEAQFMLCDDGNNVFYEELLPNSFTPSAQNGTVGIVESSNGQLGIVQASQTSQDWVCTVTGFPEISQVLGTIKLGSNGPLQFNEVLPKSAPLQVPNSLSSNEQLSEALNRSWLDLVQVETAMPQVIPEPPDNEPMITSVYCLADKENDPSEDPGLLELLSSLRRTVLPAHWVGVMVKGPLLQLFQCSKLSPMADTVLQIETGFYYQINVQNQPLLLTHPIYERHPQRLDSASLVVALLLDLEGLTVCQGYQSFEAGPCQGPLLCARAALCQLLVPQDDECCEKCLLPAEA